jgi:hypothetical protein
LGRYRTCAGGQSLVSGPLSLVEGKGRMTKDKGPAVGSKAGPRAAAPPARLRVQFGAPPVAKPAVVAVVPAAPAVAAGKQEPQAKPPRVKTKCDPELVAAARELRDRWLERVNAGEHLLAGDGKYDVSRALVARSATALVDRPVAMLPAA